jgi:hypothetical protein
MNINQQLKPPRPRSISIWRVAARPLKIALGFTINEGANACDLEQKMQSLRGASAFNREQGRGISLRVRSRTQVVTPKSRHVPSPTRWSMCGKMWSGGRIVCHGTW